MMDFDVVIEDPRWEKVGLEALAQSAVACGLEHLGFERDSVEVSLLACDDARIGELNSAFRSKDVPTNVLSWPSEERGAREDGGQPDHPVPDHTGVIELGDIAIAYDTCAREANELGKPFSAHLTHLVVHGLLHLLGYDHVRDRDATLMERIEVEILGKLGLDDPYRR